MSERASQLVEGNPEDGALTLRGLKKRNIMNEVVVHNGVEAVDYLVRLSQGGIVSAFPHPIPLSLKTSNIDREEVVKRPRGDARTQLLSVVALTTSPEGMGWPNTRG